MGVGVGGGSSCTEKGLFRQEHTLVPLLIYGHQSENFYRARVCARACLGVGGLLRNCSNPPVVILILLVTMLSMLLGS